MKSSIKSLSFFIVTGFLLLILPLQLFALVNPEDYTGFKAQAELFYMAEGLTPDSELVETDLTFLSAPTGGARFYLSGVWDPRFEDFLEYTVIKKNYIAPDNMTLDKRGEVVHDLSFGSYYLKSKKFKMGLKGSLHQGSFMAGSSRVFVMDHSWFYGAGFLLGSNLFKGRSHYSFRYGSTAFFPTKVSGYEMTSFYLHQLEGDLLYPLGKTGFRYGGRFTFIYETLKMAHTSFIRKELRVGVLLETFFK